MAVDLYLQLNPPGVSPPFYLAPNPATAYRRYGLRGFLPCALTDDFALMFDRATLRIVERRALGIGVVIVVPPPPPPTTDVVWDTPAAVNQQIAAAMAAKQPTITFTGVNLESPPTAMANRSALVVMGNFNPTKVIFIDSRFRGSGSLFAGFGQRLKLVNCQLESVVHNQRGVDQGRLVNALDCRSLELENCTGIRTGYGLYIQGDGNDFWSGDYAAGDRISIRRCSFHNVDGRLPDGTVAGSYIQSNWGPTQSNNAGYNDAGRVLGWGTANYIKLLQCCQIDGLLIEDNEFISDIALSKGEDMLAAFGGSGATQAYPGAIRNNFVVNTGGWDWNYVPGVSTSYNIGQEITLNAEGPQTPSSTTYSGTSIITDNFNTDVFLKNPSYLDIDSNVSVGGRPYVTLQAGHHNTVRNNIMLPPYFAFDGVTPFSGTRSGIYQMTEPGVKVNGVTVRDLKAADTGQYIWSDNAFRGNVLMDLAVGAADTTLGVPSSILVRGDASQSFGNLHRARHTDGGQQLYREWKARNTARGVTVGSSLPTY